MRDILPAIQAWRAEGKSVALATVVQAEGSAPRREGAHLAVSSAGEMAGSVSGGCVENDVIVNAQDVLASGLPRLLRYAISNEMTWEVGLACGGTIEVWVEPLPDPDPGGGPGSPGRLEAELEQAILEGQWIVAATCIAGEGSPGARLLVWPEGRVQGSLDNAELDRQVTAAAHTTKRPAAGLRDIPLSGGQAARVFIRVFAPPPHLVIFGGVHIAIPLAAIAKTLGYRVTVADPRTRFANRERFPLADRIIPAWPQDAVKDIALGPSTFCVILTHDPKIDEPALLSVLGRGAGYVGAIGSRKTHAARFERMARHGIEPAQLEEVYAPIGLDLGAMTPEEIALAIMAEIVAVRRGGRGGFMRDRPAAPAASKEQDR